MSDQTPLPREPQVTRRRQLWRFTDGATHAWILLAILLLALAVRLYAFRGYWGTDDGEYARLANAMAHGHYGEFVDENYVKHFYAPAHLPYRIAMVAPLALLFKTFGVGEASLVAYPLFTSVLGALLAFACGRLFFGARAGLIAAALWAVVPGDIDIATTFVPDGVASFWASMGILALLLGRSGSRRPSSRMLAVGLAAGACFGISWLAKESVVYLVPFCGILIVLDAKRDFKALLPLWAGVALASGGILMAEMVFYGLTRGDFLLRLHENERSFVQTRAYLFYEGSRFGWPVGASHAKALLKRLFLDGPSAIFLNQQFLYMPLLGAIAAARAWYSKDKSFVVPSLWLGTLAFMYVFMTVSFASYTPLVLLDRYLHPLILPASVLVGGLVVRLMEASEGLPALARREQRFWGSLIAALLVVVAGYSTFRQVRDHARIESIHQTRDVASRVGPGDTVYADPLTRKALEFYWRYPARANLHDFEGLGQEAIGPGSFVVVDATRLNWLHVNVSMWLTKDYGYHEPTFADARPAEWDVRWRNAFATLYYVR